MSARETISPQPRAFLFDAYGTLFDIYAVAQPILAGLACDPRIFAQTWRQKQMEYTWLRTMMDRYEDFWKITERALLATARQLSVQLTDERTRQLMDAYLFTPAFADVKGALESLEGLPLGVLSNGTPAMLGAAIRNNGLESHFSGVISADRLRIYKPSPRVYAMGPEVLRVPAAEIFFISSNWWDVAGAKAFGYTVCWCNRTGAEPEDMGFAPDYTVRCLGKIAEIVSRVRLGQ
jgi:2-haloacid dehalogenase